MFKNEKGFVLVNLLVSALFISVIVAISIPHIRNYKITSSLSAVGREIAGRLRTVQQLSVTEQVVYGMEFDIPSDSYEIKKYGSATTTINSFTFSDEVYIKEINGLADNRVRFNFYGGALESGEIVLGSVNNREVIIEIKPSGYVQIK